MTATVNPPVDLGLIPDDTLPLVRASVPILQMLNDALGRWFEDLQEAGEYTTHVEYLRFQVVAALDNLASFLAEDDLDRQDREAF